LPETQTSSPFGAIPNTEPLIPRPLVGLEAIMLTPDLADALQLPEQTGLLVTQVARQMPADLAGVRVGDVIVAMDGQPITDAQNFSAYLHSGSWGTQLALRVSRKGVQSTITIQLPAMGR
jgi:S1-C subfamily serine protease